MRRLPLALLLLMCPALAHADTTDLFISEYVEGTSTNKAIEIYNGTGAAVDLAAGLYTLELYSNGSATVSASLNLVGTVANGDVWVVAHGTFPTIPAPADQTSSSVINFNGDDSVVLRKNGVILDVIGQVGFDPGTEWGTGNASTVDNTMVRKSTVCAGDTDGSNVFVPADQWDGLPTNDFSNLGSHTASCSGLNIGNATVTEGDSGTVEASFTVSLADPAPVGGVTFDIATADDTATEADGDYTANSVTGAVIPQGETEYTFTVLVTGDTNVESTEQFFVNITNLVGASAIDTQAVGTITNDDYTTATISQVQGSTGTSPLVGQTIEVQGIVTAVMSGSYTVQTNGAGDGDPETSEGLLVFTAPTAVAVGDLVAVAGVVKEFVPSADPESPSITELQPVVFQEVLSSGHALPAAVQITGAMTLDASRGLDVLEYLEGMRVSVPSLTVVAPTLGGSVNETTNTSVSNGVLYGVVTGVARPFREAGVAVPNTLPAGAPANVPRFDGNPERLRVDTDARAGAAQINANSGDRITGMVGVLDYGFRTYTIYPDAGSATHVPVRLAYTPVPAPASYHFMVGSFNMNRLFDTANDPDTSDPIPTEATLASRLQRFSQAIRLALRGPDILAVQEVENLAVLEALAARILSDGGPDYAAHLVEGNDVGGIDNGFLVKKSLAGVVVTQQLDAETYVNPANGESETLHDRPPLQLEVTLPRPNGRLVVINNHHRSLSGIESTDVASSPNNLATEGERVREKRRRQAESLANHVQSIQASTPDKRLVLVGDFNTFQFNDGLVDVLGTIKGTPAAADTVVLDSPDLVNPNLTNLVDQRPATERYSFSFDGNAQTLDHALVSANTLYWMTPTVRHARLNSDFHAQERNDLTSPERNSDHDPYVVYLTLGLSGSRLYVKDSSTATSSIVASKTVATAPTASAAAPTRAPQKPAPRR